ncbi:MAG: glycosyltransferase family 4 protein [Clostridia bacterium]
MKKISQKKINIKKVLFVATVDSHILRFHLPYLKYFKETGYEVHVATNGDEKIPYCDVKHTVSFERNPFKLKNLKAIKQLKGILKNESFNIIHCHTPMGGAITRISAKKYRKSGTKVIYTAHGFHFYKGAPLLNWLIYYPIEKWLSKYTDTLVTINREDYELAKKKFKKLKNIEYVHGVGLDTKKFDIKISEEEIEKLRNEIEINKDNIVLTYVAELNKNKNQILLIKTLKELIQENAKYRLILVGDGNKKQEYEEYIKQHKLQKYVKILGKREDIPQILKLTTIYVASSLREGLPINILEAMYMRLPIIAMDNRGHRELIKNNENGFLINNDSKKIEHKVKTIIENRELAEKFIKQNNEEIKKYLLENVIKKMKKIYKGE